MADIENLNIRQYRLYELENIAFKILGNSIDFMENYRFDLESFVISKLELVPDIHYRLKSEHDTWAYMLRDCRRIFFDDQLINEDRLAKKYRFTIGEEVAHYILHPKIFADCSSIEERNKKYFALPEIERKNIENNARALASALLMHRNIFEDRVSYLLSQIDSSNWTIDQLIDNLSTALGHDFDVNFSAAKSRLKMLGYHKRLSQSS